MLTQRGDQERPGGDGKQTGSSEEIWNVPGSDMRQTWVEPTLSLPLAYLKTDFRLKVGKSQGIRGRIRRQSVWQTGIPRLPR